MSHDKSWLDERIRLGEVPEHLREAAELRRSESDFRDKADELVRSDEQILSSLPPDRFAAEVRRRHDAVARGERARSTVARPSRAAWGTAAMAACLAVGFVVVRDPNLLAPSGAPTPRTPATTSTDLPQTAPTQVPPAPEPTVPTPRTAESSDWRTKGDVELVVQRETPKGLEAVTDSDTLSSGSRLRLSVPAALPWAAVYSIDSKGEMAQHWPMQGDQAAPLPQGALPRAWELDASTGKETFVLVWSQSPFSLVPVRKAIFIHRQKPKLPSTLRVQVKNVAKAEPGK